MKNLFKKKLLIPVIAISILLTGTAFKSDFFEIFFIKRWIKKKQTK